MIRGLRGWRFLPTGLTRIRIPRQFVDYRSNGPQKVVRAWIGKRTRQNMTWEMGGRSRSRRRNRGKREEESESEENGMGAGRIGSQSREPEEDGMGAGIGAGRRQNPTSPLGREWFR